MALKHLGSALVAGMLVMDGSAAAIYVCNNATIYEYSLSAGNNWSAYLLKSNIPSCKPVFRLLGTTRNTYISFV